MKVIGIGGAGGKIAAKMDSENAILVNVSQTELDAFFQSVLGRPSLVRARVHWDEDFWPDLLPGQVPLPPTDYSGWGEIKQVIEEPDGALYLYGQAGWSEAAYSVTCRIRPTQDFLGWRIESTEMCPVMNGSSATFTP